MAPAALTSARPSSLAEAMFRREIVPWALLGLTLGVVEGATAAVLLKRSFVTTDALAVNFAVALVSGASAMSNVVSFVWSNVAHGRERVGLLVALQGAFAVLVGMVGLAPRVTAGLAFTVLSILAARTVWAGILTLRASVWTANYPRAVLARITGRIVVVSSFTMAAASGLAGWALESHAVDARLIYGGASLSGLFGAWLYRRMRVRREFQLLAAESEHATEGTPFSLRMLGQILREDPDFREYMFWMGLYGGGGLMLTGLLVVVFTERLGLPGSTQIALLAVVPLGTLPFFVPWWARLFDGTHVVAYRSRQGWAMVVGVTVMCGAAFAGSMILLWVGAVLLGAAYAGANLGWNLGHTDFASLGRAQHYMGVHVTLTGVRGVIAPPLGIVLYETLEHFVAGSGRYALLAPVAMTVAGAYGFTMMKRRMTR